MRDLRLVAGAVIYFKTFSFSANAPPMPWLSQVNEWPLVGVGVGDAVGDGGVWTGGAGSALL
jgi:hypothetical protein